MIRRILVPLDGTAEAATILPIVGMIARVTDATLTLLRVLPIGAAADEAGAALAAAATPLVEGALTVDTRVAHGQPAREIARMGSEHDLIALATRRRSGLERLMRGSVADAVVCTTSVPVLLAWATEGEARAPEPPRRIIVPLDGSTLAEQALPMATDLARRSGATIVLVTSIRWATRALGIDPGLLEPASLDRAALGEACAQQYVTAVAHEEAHDYLGRIVRHLRHDGLKVEMTVCLDEPATAILRQATDPTRDLIVMTTHGRSGLRRWLLGSIAEHVLRAAPGPVMVLRATAPLGIDQPAASASRRARWRTERSRSWRRAPMKVREIMTRPVVTVGVDSTLEEVARTMLAHAVGCVPVVDGAGLLRGIITEASFTGQGRVLPFSSEPLLTLFGERIPKESVESLYASARAMTAGQVMNETVFTLDETDSVTTAVEELIRRNVNHLPVVRDGAPIGMVARHDLLRLMVRDGTNH